MIHRIGLRVGSEKALDFWTKRLTSAAREPIREDDRLRFADPEGLGYEVIARPTTDAPLVAVHPEIPEELYQTEQPDVAEGEFLRLLDQLPKSQRDVVLMLKVSGMSLEEVARATSVSVGAVKQRAHRAYGKLRAILTSNRPIPSVSTTGVQHEPRLRHPVPYIQQDTQSLSV
jgi:RNA polymerase sigma factor (sigma-70 family)